MLKHKEETPCQQAVERARLFPAFSEEGVRHVILTGTPATFESLTLIICGKKKLLMMIINHILITPLLKRAGNIILKPRIAITRRRHRMKHTRSMPESVQAQSE